MTSIIQSVGMQKGEKIQNHNISFIKTKIKIYPRKQTNKQAANEEEEEEGGPGGKEKRRQKRAIAQKKENEWGKRKKKLNKLLQCKILCQQ